MGVIGYGYWGPNIVRNLHGLDSAQVVAVCDRSPEAQKRAKHAYPDVTGYLRRKRNPAFTGHRCRGHHHPRLDAFRACQGRPGKRQARFRRKALTSNVDQAEELIELAQKKNLKIMVDHTFLFTGAVKKIRQLIDQGELGDLYYYDSTRVNLGLFQHDIDVIWDLAPHDLSIMDYLIRKEPEAVVATGQAHLNAHADVAFITVYFPHNTIAHINVNWLSPVKVRTTLIGGEKKMLVWNDLEADEKVKVYDKGVQIDQPGRRLRIAGQLPLRRHVGAQDRADRSPEGRIGILLGLHREQTRRPSMTAWRDCVLSKCWKRRQNR